MRLALKHQIILAPATVLLLMTLLLGFLQYTYWDLSVKRQEARRLGYAFIALAEADLAAQRIQTMTNRLRGADQVEAHTLEELDELYFHLFAATRRIFEFLEVGEEDANRIRKIVTAMSPENGFDAGRILKGVEGLRPEFTKLSDLVQAGREKLRDVHNHDIDALVARTAFVSIAVLSASILLGIFLSLTFARRILRRIQSLSESARRIAAGDLSPPPAPPEVHDELDELVVSINRMTERLIQVVGTEKLLEGAEEERRRIAMDIHDQTLSDLSSVLRGIQELKSRDACGEEAVQLEDDLQRAIANLREVMDNLHPQTLDILGLGAALQSYLERYLGREDLPEYHLYVSPRIESLNLRRNARLALYRIALEAIHNVVRHAGASRYEVCVDSSEDLLTLAVEDNGCGFDAQAVLAGGHRGLNNIRERAKTIGARAVWGPSRFTTGNRFELTLPLAAVRDRR